MLGIFFVIGSISYFSTFNYNKIENIKDIEENLNEEKIVEDSIVEEKKDENLKIQNENIENESKDENENNEKSEEKVEVSSKNETKISTKELLSLFFSRKNAHILAISIGGPCKKLNILYD